MTPTASRLKVRLEDRRRWFINEWFFKWHFIGKDRPVSIDSFEGRGIHLGGIKFDGSARDVYWETIVRGVRREIDEQYAWVDQQIRNYNLETALKSIDECASQLISFVRSIRREAIIKDRILRGNGIDFPAENDAGRWDTVADNEIRSQAKALKEALPAPPINVVNGEFTSSLTRRQRASKIWHDNQGWLGPIGLLIGLAGLVPFFI